MTNKEKSIMLYTNILLLLLILSVIANNFVNSLSTEFTNFVSFISFGLSIFSVAAFMLLGPLIFYALFIFTFKDDNAEKSKPVRLDTSQDERIINK